MTQRARALTIVGIVWLAGIVAATAAMVARRGSHYGGCTRETVTTGTSPFAPGQPRTITRCVTYATVRTFDWGGLWGWVGALTLAAVVAAVIVAVATSGTRS